ncbi:carbohydrate esterase family 16 protein [Lentithecium fluviatile CBS 122367]|uniref:Carbohydrate esterase family 16 protein n=1 Tax=Lentithecium fluviatile CBS 122367 TaxID=1168545 RepID=A0A6G1IU70_9PLEO|nr:carbohydrate esterase family 16 protein [Lentithecium fluviatile CBS 122367]
MILLSALFNWRSTKALVAFGDSYTYVQGVLGHQNYTYIGDNLNLAFTPQQLLSNRIVQNQTSTAEGGPNWVEYLTNCGVKPGLTDPRKCDVQLWDFAYAGSDVSEVLTPLHHDHTVSLARQVEQFEDYGNPALEHVLDKKETLVAIWIGINDINDLAKLRGKNTAFAPLYEQVQTQLFQLVKQIYDLGYPNFLFMNLPPLDRGPSPSVNASLVLTFNSIHSSHATAFQATHPDAAILQFDVNAMLNGILDHPGEYGIKNITNFCPGYNQPDIRTDPAKYGCGEGLDTYFWYDSGHLTTRVHQIFVPILRDWLSMQSV